MEVQLSALEGPEIDAWTLLFHLHTAYPDGWMVVGAQMVIVHAARYEISRPVRTGDTDVLVDIRSVDIREVAQWLLREGFELEGVSAEGIGHRFFRGEVKIDLLSIDHSGKSANRTTVPPARTIEVPGGRQAINRTVEATIHIGNETGTIPIPDWIGAILLKARAAVSLPQERQKHLRDLALLLGLPADLPRHVETITKRERKRLREGIELITEDTWTSVRRSIDPRNAQIAISLLLRESNT
jgi:predicted nucleotidyltransferase